MSGATKTRAAKGLAAKELARLEEENAALGAADLPTQPNLTAMLKALGFASATSPTTPAVVSFDPYDTQALDTNTKDGKYQWAVVTRTIESWKVIHLSRKCQ